MLMQEDRLTLAVNRDGFLLTMPWTEMAGAIGLYRNADPEYWGRYTIGSVFFFGETPAALLYRDDFFIELGTVLPDPRVWGLIRGSPRPVAVEIPSLKDLDPREGWDVDVFMQGRDGFWYYRGISKKTAQGIGSYFRTPDPAVSGEKTSAGVFRNASLPYSIDSAPVVLGRVLSVVCGLTGAETFKVATVYSPEFEGTRYFSAGPAQSDQVIELAGCYLNGNARGYVGEYAGEYALAILPDGRGAYGKRADPSASIEGGRFDLPPLPEGFVYTHVGLSGSAIVAAWEEQQGWNVGAAGFLVIDLP
jgi:hypothetical protein